MTFTLPTLTAWKKKRFLEHAERVLTAQQQMQSLDGKNILHYTLNELPFHEHMIHYPKGDRIDHSTGAQYFYHCDREDQDQEEHGHFHCFIRYDHIPKHIKPKPLSDWNKYIENPMTHLVAIAMNRFGQPTRLFSVNRWVTEEVWYDTHHTPNFIRRFKMTKEDSAYWQVLDQWIEGMIRLFSPQIEWLNHQRDRFMNEHLTTNPDINPYEDTSIEVISDINISLPQQIEWIMNSTCKK